MADKEIELFGIFRSGTNFTRTVLEWNYECQLTTNHVPWKHGFYPIIVKRSILEYPRINTLFVTKNPFSSINSLFNYYQNNGRNIYAGKEWRIFLRKRFITYDFFQDDSPQYRFANVVDFWNAMNWNFASVKNSGLSSAHVRYEDMLDDTINYTQAIANHLQLTPMYSDITDFRIPTRVTKNMGDQPRSIEDDYLTGEKFDKKKYADKDYYNRFSNDDIQFVLDNIDMDLIKHLGYEDEINKATEQLVK